MSTIRLCALADLPDGMVMQVECDGTPVALARIGDSFRVRRSLTARVPSEPMNSCRRS